MMDRLANGVLQTSSVTLQQFEVPLWPQHHASALQRFLLHIPPIFSFSIREKRGS